MQVKRVQLRVLKASEQPRPLITEAVDKLAASIKEVGLIQPITVRPATVMDGGLAAKGYQIIAGHHRVAAVRALGWTEVDAIVVDAAEHLQAELIEIDENLCRSELSPAQRTAAIKRRKEIWEALHPAERVSAQLEPKPMGGRPTEFASETAKVTGEAKSSINRHLARAEALGDDLPRVAGTSLDKGVELDALKSLPESERKDLIDRAVAGEQVSARKAAPQAVTSENPAIAFSKMLHAALDAFRTSIGYYSDEAAGRFIGAEAEKLGEDDYRAFFDAKQRMDEFLAWTESVGGANGQS